MSTLRSGDEAPHYSDSSHRWPAADPANDATWTLTVQAQMDEHRATMGAPYLPTRLAGPVVPSHLDRCSPA